MVKLLNRKLIGMLRVTLVDLISLLDVHNYQNRFTNINSQPPKEAQNFPNHQPTHCTHTLWRGLTTKHSEIN